MKDSSGTEEQRSGRLLLPYKIKLNEKDIQSRSNKFYVIKNVYFIKKIIFQ